MVVSQSGFAYEFQFWDYECRFGITESGLPPYPLHKVTDTCKLYMLAIKLVKYWRLQYGKRGFQNKYLCVDIFLSVNVIFSRISSMFLINDWKNTLTHFYNTLIHFYKDNFLCDRTCMQQPVIYFRIKKFWLRFYYAQYLEILNEWTVRRTVTFLSRRSRVHLNLHREKVKHN